jgi:20S proteasome subunit alpha 6
MFRNQYDNDTTVWSPQGRLLQVEYACEAVKQGAVAIGLRNGTHVVLLALKRSPGDLASHQRKMIPVDEHVGIAFSGLTSDARVLGAFMRNEALEERAQFSRPISLYKLALLVADKAQNNTQFYGGRPYGVGLLLAGSDETGPHLYECSPTGQFFEYYGIAIGARSQPARTYLERHLDEFSSSKTLEDLIQHGLYALNASLPQDIRLSNLNTSIAVVESTPKPAAEQKGSLFHICTEEQVSHYLDQFKATVAPTTGITPPMQSMDVDGSADTTDATEDVQ